MIVGGPSFQIESDEAFLALGHSERRRVGEFLASTLVHNGVFQDIHIVTTNELDSIFKRKALREEMKTRTVVGHSAAEQRIPAALQIIAFNPPEHVDLLELLKRAAAVTKDMFEKESGAHKTGILDLVGAGFELLRSPITTVETTLRIARGYSTVARLSASAEMFPAGRAIVHSQNDTFGFAALADYERANQAGITTVQLPDHYHNEVLFAPQKTIDLLTPVIFPAK